MHARALLPFLLLVLSPLAGAQDVAVAPDTMAVRFERLAQRLEELAEEHHAPGMGLAVVTPEGHFLRGFGQAELATGRAVSPDTRFEIGSTTKTFTALACTMLDEAGELSLDDLVREHVEGFRLRDEAANEKVDLRDLLSHRTGLTRTDLILSGGDQLEIADVVAQLAECEPMAPFRSTFLYNNQMFLVAGLAAQNASGIEYAELIDELLFDPLGMEDSFVRLEDGRAGEDVAAGYKWLRGDERLELQPTVGIHLSEPAGSIWSTPRDMARYIAFLLARGEDAEGNALLPAVRFDEDLWKPHNKMGPGAAYGLGFMLGEWQDRPLAHHGGNVDGFTSMMALLPSEGLGFSLLINANMSPLQEASVNVVFETMLGLEPEEEPETAPAEAGLSAEELAPYVGDFDFAQAAQTFTTAIREDGKLTLDVPGQTAYELNWPDADGKWAFTLVPEQVQVSFQREGDEVSAIVLHQGGAEIVMPRKAVDSSLPGVEEVLAKIDESFSMEHFESLLPIRLVGEVRMPQQGLVGVWTLTYQDDEHFRTDMDFGRFGRIVTVLAGDEGWVDTGMQGRNPLSETERQEAKRDAAFGSPSHRRDDFASMKVLGVTGEGDDARWQLKLVPKIGEPVVLHVSPQTGHTMRMEAAISLGELGAIPIQSSFDRYESVLADPDDPRSGVPFAMETRSENPMMGRTEVSLSQIETRVSIPASTWTEK